MRICVASCVGAGKLRAGVFDGMGAEALLPQGWDPAVAVYQFTLCRIDAMALGGLLAVMVRELAARHGARGWDPPSYPDPWHPVD